ncbi:MAG: BTAD domain-containing putative transcriptional regulator [Actinomycetota bacterium]
MTPVARDGSPGGRLDELEVGVLGSLALTVGGRPADPGPLKQRLLLLRLVASHRQAVPLDLVVEALWPDRPPGAPDASVRAYASNLRRILEPSRPSRAASVLRRDAHTYTLELPAGALDAERFEDEITAAREAGRPALRVARIEAALSRWRGEPFAEAAELPFAQVAVSRLRGLHRDAQELRVDALLDSGRARAAVSMAEELVDDDPLAERGWALLMTAWYRAGHQGEALRAYGRARRTLLDELGLEPGAELCELERRILAHDRELLGVRRPSAPSGPGRGDEPFVGRDAELAAVRDVLTAAGHGEHKVAVISGDAGVGKTRLVDAALAAAGPQLEVVQVQCDRQARGAGLLPLLSPLREAVEIAGRDGVGALLGDDRGLLADVDPWTTGPSSIHDQDDTARFQRFDALVRLLGRLAVRRPLVLVVEDAHWAGPRLWEFLVFAIRRLAGTSVAVLVTVREGEIPGALRSELAWLRGSIGSAPVDIAELDGEAVTSLAAALLGDGGRAVADEVHRRSGGNAYFAVELLRAIDPGDPVTSFERLDLPSSLRQVIAGRVADLPSPASELLTVAALWGGEFDLPAIARVAEIGLDDAAEVVDEAIDTGLLVETGERVGRLAFRHDLVREAIVAGLSRVRRAQWHSLIGRWLWSAPSSDPARVAQTAHHLALGAPAGTALDAARAARRAIGASFARHESGVAQCQAEEALAALEHDVGPAAPRHRLEAELWCDLAIARKRTGDVLGSHEAARRAYATAESVGHREVMISATLCLAGGPATSRWQAYWSPAAEATDMAARTLAADPDALTPRQHILLECALASNAGEVGDLPRAWLALRRALHVAVEIGSDELMTNVLLERWRIADIAGSTSQRRGTARQALDRALAAGFGDGEAMARRALVVLALEDGRRAAAEQELDRLRSLAERERSELVAYDAANLEIGIDLMMGRLDAAERHITDALERFGHFDSGRLDVVNLQIAGLSYERHRLDTIEPEFRRRLADQDTVSWRAPLALLLAEHDRRDEAEALLASMPRSDFDSLAEPPLQFLSAVLLAGAVAELDDRERAGWLLGLLEHRSERLVSLSDGILLHGWVALPVGRLLGLLERSDEATEHLAFARARAYEVGSTLLELRARVALAELDVRQGGDRAADLDALEGEASATDLAGVAAWVRRLRRRADAHAG